jgi:hypothetical protein
MRKTILVLAVAGAFGAAVTGAAAAPPQHRGYHHWRGAGPWRPAPQWRGETWGTFNDVYNNPTGYHCGGGAYISCAPNW